MLLAIEHISDLNLHVVKPHPGGQEFIFDDADVAALFCRYYFDNPIAAVFAYNLQKGK